MGGARVEMRVEMGGAKAEMGGAKAETGGAKAEMGGLRVIKRMVQMVALGLGWHWCQWLGACCEQRLHEAAARKHILREPQGSDRWLDAGRTEMATNSERSGVKTSMYALLVVRSLIPLSH